MCPSHPQSSSRLTLQRPRWATLISNFPPFWISSFFPVSIRLPSCLWFKQNLNTLLWSQIPLLSTSSALLSIHGNANIDGEGGLRFPAVAIFLHATNALGGQINRNASWSGTHRRTGDAPSLPPPTLFPSSSTGEMAFVLVHSAVHHSGTKRLNQVAWSNSPWGFNAPEKRDYSLAALVLQRTPLWYCTMCKPFPNAFPQCKTELGPWDSCHGGRKIQKSIRHAPYWSTPPSLYIENVLYVRRMGKGR